MGTFKVHKYIKKLIDLGLYDKGILENYTEAEIDEWVCGLVMKEITV